MGRKQKGVPVEWEGWEGFVVAAALAAPEGEAVFEGEGQQSLAERSARCKAEALVLRA
ncbi:hypothetical protein AA106555_0895 [Neokomagataea thailandica NBRC 106555]|uniref:Transposase n=1 Tax=Neokomagataea thailandica NBRC 106555 TaxID=1223520 RepID=A0ABQ0QPH1_9PROT|nr:hypothetical protein AA106555_0895 [Neokomagataea thailandica NBRC 106555]